MPTFRVLYPAAAQKFLYALPTATLPQSLSDELFECIESYTTLQEITAIASSNPAATLGVSKIRYLLCTLEAHLNEFYIFWRRLDALLTKFERTYRHSFLHSALNAQLKIVRRLIEQENLAAISVRGRHVHERRYFDRSSAADVPRCTRTSFRLVAASPERVEAHQGRRTAKSEAAERHGTSTPQEGFCRDQSRFDAFRWDNCSTIRKAPNRRFQLQKRSQLFICTHDETLSVVEMRVNNPDCSAFSIHC